MEAEGDGAAPELSTGLNDSMLLTAVFPEIVADLKVTSMMASLQGKVSLTVDVFRAWHREWTGGSTTPGPG